MSPMSSFVVSCPISMSITICLMFEGYGYKLRDLDFNIVVGLVKSTTAGMYVL
jgi:hypothetical protein